jgi:CRISPR system Cascade subunit CasC
MLIQFHLLQNYQPSNLNRDDTGSPKDAIFGGVLRGRISSQCLKRSIRHSDVFKAFDSEGLLGKRTQMLPTLVGTKLSEMGVDEKTAAAILSRLPDIVRGKTKAEKGEEGEEDTDDGTHEVEETTATEDTKQLVFLDVTTELATFAERLHKAYREIGAGKWAKAKLTEINKYLGESLPRSVDIALFGRMTTAQAFRNVRASAQVAHALSTNALKQEFDYYTALDDLKPDSEPGADMIGDIEYNSCTYYKYLNVHWNNLVDNLGGDKEVARRAVLALLEAAAMAHPTGKQNSFGAFNLPDFVLVEVSDRNLPVSYANAFLKPAYGTSNQSLLTNSVEQLSKYVTRLSKVYDLAPQRAFIAVDDDLAFLDQKPRGSLDDLKKWLEPQLG